MTPNMPVQLTSANGGITGALNGSNRTFVLTGISATSVEFFWNGLLMTPGLDYVRSGNTVTMIAGPPNSADVVSAAVWTS